MKPTEVSFETLKAKELALETLCGSRGMARYAGQLERNKKQKTETKVVKSPARSALQKSLVPVSKAIADHLEERKHIKAPKPLAIKFLTELGPDVSAYLTGMAVLDSLSSTVMLNTVCKRIAGYFIDELRYRHFQQHAEALFNWRMKTFNTSSYVHMKRSLDATLLYAQQPNEKTGKPPVPPVPEWIDLDNPQRLQVGAFAFQLFKAATGLVMTEQQFIGKANSPVYVRATAETVEWMAKVRNKNEKLAPVCLPTVMKPAPWGPNSPGGYWYAQIEGGLGGKHPLIRSMFDNRSTKGYEQAQMPVVYEALNNIQDTPYLINEQVLRVMTDFYGQGSDIAGLPNKDPQPIPPRPDSADTDKEAQLVWRKKASIIHEENHDAACCRKNFEDTIDVARLMIEQGVPFYYPHNLDFRGRAYPIPVYLQPQGDDISRGLLLLGSKKALGSQEAVDWLCIHGANNLGKTSGGEALDKASFEDRIQWVLNNSDLICAAASDPYEYRGFWAGSNVDNPWQFLAFCFEWKAFCDSGRSLDFECSLPGSMDGSCNGLQHYAALLKDEALARSVNLVPNKVPQDIYRVVAAEVMRLLRSTATSNDETAKAAASAWLKWNKVDRKFVKRPVMTLPYGSSAYGFKGQIKEFLKALAVKDRPEFFKTDDEAKTIMFMATTIFSALALSTRSAVQAMDFFQECAKLAARSDTPIQWTAPSGLPVQQAYPQMSVKEVDTMLAGSIRFTAEYTTPVLDSEDGHTILNPAKQVSGIAPNIIHSLDASAMMLTVVAAKAAGIDCFMMVHDSFGCHMADAPLMNQIVRETFSKMYAGDKVLAGLVADLTSNIDITKLKEDEEIPTAPAQGSLNIVEVLASKYFFA